MTQPRTQPPPTERRRLIDFSLPITWIVAMFFSGVSGLVFLGWMAANQSNKLTQVVESQTKIERKQDESSTRTDLLRDQFMELKQTQAILAIRVGTLERDAKK